MIIVQQSNTMKLDWLESGTKTDWCKSVILTLTEFCEETKIENANAKSASWLMNYRNGGQTWAQMTRWNLQLKAYHDCK